MTTNKLCIDCGLNKKAKDSHVCNECFDRFMKKIKGKCRDVRIRREESRLSFLMRVSKELGLDRTEKEIKTMINQGYTDEMILNQKRHAIWRPSYVRGSNIPV